MGTVSNGSCWRRPRDLCQRGGIGGAAESRRPYGEELILGGLPIVDPTRPSCDCCRPSPARRHHSRRWRVRVGQDVECRARVVILQVAPTLRSRCTVGAGANTCKARAMRSACIRMVLLFISLWLPLAPHPTSVPSFSTSPRRAPRVTRGQVLVRGTRLTPWLTPPSQSRRGASSWDDLPRPRCGL